MASNQSKYSAAYNAKRYDQLAVHVERGGKDILKRHYKGRDKSLNAFVVRAIRQALEDDGAAADDIRAVCGDDTK